MSNDTKFIEGLIAKAPHEKAPEYVKAKLSIKREELIAWLQSQTGEWINADVKVSQQGKWYVQVDQWRADGKHQESKPIPLRETPRDEHFDDFPPF
ncbi:hypothetical protein LF41_2378 [Lysobacter dokdonensis DS-58]|uniref:Uncharacterized protein n=1 Tax=Lysobacter dokdonensis DS-58 TaxID=1300345 RepID=A0A0A2WI54_9GAMM|nr:hypothetical protein [Lysobacter dokdonensis]KGQ19871.1 hypothetical protein LF41_2378 [Lysobacter dokdonensis DS-58]